MKLVGTHFGFMQKIRSLGGPMSDALADTTRTEFMCKAHECAWEGYFIVCDINRNNILVGIRHDGKEFMFSEDGTNHPKMTEWINKH